MDRPARRGHGARRRRPAAVPLPARRGARGRRDRRGRGRRQPDLPHGEHAGVPALRAPGPRRGRPPGQGDRRPRLQRARLRPRHLPHSPALQPAPPQVPHAPGRPAGRGPLGAGRVGGGARHDRRALPADPRGGRERGVPQLRGDRQLVDALDGRARALLGLLEPLRRDDADHLAALLRLGHRGLQRRLRRRAVRVPRRVGAQPVLPGLGQQPGRLQPGLHEEPLPGPRGARRAAGDDRSPAERDGRPLRPVDPGPAGHGRRARPGHGQGAARRGAVRRRLRAHRHQRPVPGAPRRARLRPAGGGGALAGGRQRAAGGSARAAAPDERRQRPRELRGLGRAGRAPGPGRHAGRAARPARELRD